MDMYMKIKIKAQPFFYGGSAKGACPFCGVIAVVPTTKVGRYKDAKCHGCKRDLFT